MKGKINKERLKKKFYIFYHFVTNGEERGISFWEPFKNVVDEAYANNKQTVMKRIDAEINIWLREMFPPEIATKLIQKLKDEDVFDIT